MRQTRMAVVAVALVAVASVAVAQFGGDLARPGGASDTYAQRTARVAKVLYDSGDVAAGAIITSPDIDTSAFETVAIYIRNADGAATRAVTVASKASGQAVAGPSFTCPTNSFSLWSIGVGATTNTGVAAASSMPPAPTTQVTLAAAGSSIGRIIVYAR